MDFDSNNWERAKQLFETALDLDPAQRSAFLNQNCHDETLRRQVEQLLLNYQQAGSFLSDPAFGSREAHTAESSPSDATPPDLAPTVTSATDDQMAGRVFGAYKLVKRIGQGGMAAVFLAVRADDAYRKEVAVKLVQPGADSHDLLSRFRNERQTLAGLDHPNIVKLLDGGSSAEGLPFLVMDYVEGCPIDDYCDHHQLHIDDRLRLFSKVCDAVQYAHQKSIVHRDLKPSNILVTTDGTPKLLDFGIAKVLNPDPSAQPLLLTQTGTRCMTPAYASPEQMRGKSITTATDVYSLGVVLYELLTGHRPYRLTQHTPAEVERAICEQDPETPSTAISRVETDTSSTGVPITRTPELVSSTREHPPEKLRRRLRGDLDNIVLKALQKEPARRYGSIAEFSQDIHRHLQHLPVKARPSTLTYRISKLVQRHKAEVSAMMLAALAVLAAGLFVSNPLGLRNHLLKNITASRIQPSNNAGSVKTKGWVNAGNVYDTRLISPNITPAVSCESLSNLSLPNATITLTQSVPAGSFTPPGSEPIKNLPAFCRTQGVIKPSADSDIRYELWMPSSGWNGRFRGVGNGGLGGSINYDDMAPAVRLGYATASTDTGHRTDDRNGAWALGHREKIVDVGYRAIHEMTAKTRQLIQAFYGQSPQWSFFEGCSNGGRQALMEAQRFPKDYDGVLAGAPPVDTTHILAAGVYNSGPDAASYIPPDKISAISRAVLNACDALDGLSDGILNDPRQCHFDPSVLACHGADSNNCLTAGQVAQLKKIYSGLQTSSGDQLFPGYLPGGEQGEEGWKGWITGAAPGGALNFIFGLAVYRNMVFNNARWDPHTVPAERAVQIADEEIAGIVNTTDPDLRRFTAHGGKLILYNGWSDAETPALIPINYYNSVLSTLGSEEASKSVRLYLAPGMQHCYGGPGPNYFGQFDLSAFAGSPDQASIAADPQHNISRALEDWVERGIAPSSIIATKYVNDADPTQGVKMTRPLCPYPQSAKYKGSGDTNDAANFICAETNDQHSRTLTP